MNLFDSEVQTLNAKYETMAYRLSDKLSDPKTLLEVCEFAIANPELSTNAIAECLE